MIPAARSAAEGNGGFVPPPPPPTRTRQDEHSDAPLAPPSPAMMTQSMASPSSAMMRSQAMMQSASSESGLHSQAHSQAKNVVGKLHKPAPPERGQKFGETTSTSGLSGTMQSASVVTVQNPGAQLEQTMQTMSTDLSETVPAGREGGSAKPTVSSDGFGQLRGTANLPPAISTDGFDQLRGAAGMPQAPPSTPFLPSGIDPLRAYEVEAEKCENSGLQREALATLHEWDDGQEARFTARQVLNLVKHLEAVSTEPQKKRWRDQLTCGSLVWLAIALLLLWILQLLSVLVARDTHLDSSGILYSSSEDLVIGLGRAVTRHSFADLCSMELADLRRVVDCTFVHHGAHFNLRVASLIRTPDGYVRITSPDSAMLHVDQGGARAMLERPFHGKENVDLSAVPFLSGVPAQVPSTTGCSLAVMAPAPGRAAR